MFLFFFLVGEISVSHELRKTQLECLEFPSRSVSRARESQRKNRKPITSGNRRTNPSKNPTKMCVSFSSAYLCSVDTILDLYARKTRRESTEKINSSLVLLYTKKRGEYSIYKRGEKKRPRKKIKRTRARETTMDFRMGTFLREIKRGV